MSSEPDNVVPLTPSQKSQFKPGNTMAKRKRAHNKITRDLKEGIIDAAIAVGEDGKGKGGLLGYLKMLARKHPKYYTQLLARVLPLQVSGGVDVGFIGQVNIVPVPGERYLTPEDVARMLQPPLEIEGEAADG
ncbi:hypothetical protein JQ543_05050 [Bradyrhizobium diazoefficiens]|nr:hypothetical protein [Bradyrhizobium diazoefficiens]MBR0847108.1 hypothetical protein [Bradyrhizobium diazoefficiens]